MAIDPTVNFGKVNVSTGYDASATSVDLSAGEGATLPDPGVDGAYNLVWWNAAAYPDPADDPNVEIVRVTARSSDTLTVTRAQEGTGASTKNTSGGEYKMILAPTKKTIDDIGDEIGTKQSTSEKGAANGYAGLDASGFIPLSHLPLSASSPLSYNSGTGAFSLGTVTPANGGTGLTTFAVGDILYADTTSSLARLADVATGQVLVSGGVGVAPAWSGAVTLSTSLVSPIITANNNTSQSSFRVSAASGIATQSATASLQIGGSTNVQFRTFFNGVTSTVLTANASYASTIFGTQPATEGTSGTHGVLANVAINAPVFTNGTATTTDATTLYIAGAPTGTFTPTNTATALWVDSGTVRVDDTLGVGTGSPSGKLTVKGTGTSTNTTFLLTDSADRSLFQVNDAGFVGMSTAPSSLWKLDFVGQYFQMGSDNTSNNSRTDATVKLFGIVTPHYTNAQNPVWGIGVQSTSVANNVFIGGGVTSGANAATAIYFSTASSTTGGVGTPQMLLSSNLLRIGAGDATATPSAFTIAAPRVSGVSDTAGVNTTFISSLATGNASSGDFLFQTGNPGSSGSTIQTATTRMAIKGGTGYVGIGTSSPTVPLHVAGAIMGLYSTANANIVIDRGGTNRLGSMTYSTAGTENWFTGMPDSDIRGDGTEYFIGTSNSDPKLWMKTTGEIGIGTSDLVSYTTTQQTSATRVTPILQNHGTSTANGIQSVARFTTAQTGPGFYFGKSGTATVGQYGAVSTNHQLGNISFQGADGTQFVEGAYIQGRVNGTVATDIVPTDLRFATMDSAGGMNVVMTLTNTPQVITTNGSAAAPAIAMTSSTTTGLYRATADTLGISVAGTALARFNSVGIRLIDGTGADPSYSFTSDADTGMFRGGTNILGFSTAATERARIDASGNFGIGATSLGAKLHVTNTTDAASNLAAIFESDRATPTANDEVYISFKLSDSAGNQDEFGRIRVAAEDTTSTSEDGAMKFSLVGAGSMTGKMQLNGTALSPLTSDGIALGSTTLMWSDLFLASGGVINFNNGNYTITHSAGLLTTNGNLSVNGTSGILSTGTVELGHASDTTVSRSAAGVIAVEGADVPTISSTSTLTNKRIQPRSSTAASGDITPALATANVWQRTALSAGIAINSPTGTPVLGEVLVFMLLDDGTSRALTWDSAFTTRVMGEALPTATTVSKQLLVTCQYNGSTWLCLSTEEA